MHYLLFIVSRIEFVIQIELKFTSETAENMQKVKVEKIFKKFKKSC